MCCFRSDLGTLGGGGCAAGSFWRWEVVVGSWSHWGHFFEEDSETTAPSLFSVSLLAVRGVTWLRHEIP